MFSLANVEALAVALLVAAAVGMVAFLLLNLVNGGATRAIISAMPKYSPRNFLDAKSDEQPQVSIPSFTTRLADSVTRGRYKNWLVEKLADLGLRGELAYNAQLAKKATYSLAGALLGALYLTKGVIPGVGALVAGALLGFALPDLLLVSEGQKRAEELERGLPDAIDLLNLCVESGLSFEQALSRVSIGLDGPVAEEFGGLIADLRLGLSRVDAMGKLAERTRSKGLKRFIGSLLQVDRLGIPISGVLAEQATEMRAIRKDRAREQGQKVTIKILMPLMFCFLPAMFVIVLGPAVVQLIKTMSLLH